jgi:hypothetical protein
LANRQAEETNAPAFFIPRGRGGFLRVCLINAPIGTDYKDPSEFNSQYIREESCYPQLGILSLAAVLENGGWPTTIFDINREFFLFADLAGEAHIHAFAEAAAEQIAAFDADVYGFGSICSGYPMTLRVARSIKALRPESMILLGGPQASVVAERTLAAFPFVNFILRGEAERSLPDLLEELAGGRRFQTVPGLTYRSVFGVQRNADAPVVMDLDSLPFPAYHLTGELRESQVASLELGRGCPFACTFCSTNDFFRRKYRLRSPERVLEDMCAIESEYGIRRFQLNHDMFTVDAKRVREFCRFMIDSRKGYRWNCSARTDCVDEELINLMAEAGCREIFFGVETGSDRMQKVIDKHLDTKRAHEIIDLTDRAGVGSTISLIAGFHEETWEDLCQTLEMYMHSARTPKSNPQLNILAPLANTPLHLKHRHELALAEFCSDISHQGRRLDDQDTALIKEHPDIFSSFYLVPTPYLDRATVFELREFLNNASERLRWILVAAGQTTGGIGSVFVEWVKRRKSLQPDLSGSELRWYYRLPRFTTEFCGFLRDNFANNSRAMMLLEFDDAMNQEDTAEPPPILRGVELGCGDPAAPSDVAVIKNQSRIVEFEWDLKQVIDTLQEGSNAESERGPHFYVVPQNSDQHIPLCEVSVYIAKVTELCDGIRTVAQVMEGLKNMIPVSPESAAAKLYLALLEEARSEGIIAIYRPLQPAENSAPDFTIEDGLRAPEPYPTDGQLPPEATCLSP